MTTLLYRCLLALVAIGLAPAAWSETTIARLGTPGAFEIQVNPVTNKAYVATGSGVGVIDGATHTLMTIGSPGPVGAIAIDPASGRIFATRLPEGAIDVFDGTTHAHVRIAAGPVPQQVVVNPVTGDAYVTSEAGVTAIAGSDFTATNIVVGASPRGLAVNPVTNKVYVGCNGNVWVIDGATRTATILAAGVASDAVAIAVNPVTDRVYAIGPSNSVLAIDGTTGASVAIPTGSGTVAIALNPATNKIYVAGGAGGGVASIDGATNVATPIGGLPSSIGFAINPVTNTIYVRRDAISSNTTVGVIDGGTNAVRTFQTGAPHSFATSQTGMAVNPVTNMLYVSQSMLGVDVVDASVNAVTTVAVPGGPTPHRNTAINPVTGKIYFSAYGSSTVTVLDEATLTTTEVTVGPNPMAIAVNFKTDRTYVVVPESGAVAMIDGPTNAVTTIPVGGFPAGIAVNSVTNKIYVGGSGFITVIDGASNSTATIPVPGGGAFPVVNEATNRIYVAVSGGVIEIDANSGAQTRIATTNGSAHPIVINPVTNKIYAGIAAAASMHFGKLAIIEGATRAVTVIDLPAPPAAMVVNPLTNKIYLGLRFGGGVYVIDGATNAQTRLDLGVINLAGLAVDTVHDRIYAIDAGNMGPPASSVVIDGRSNVASSIAVGEAAASAVLNPVTGRVYFTHWDRTDITVLRPSVQTLMNHDTDVSMAGGHVTSSAMPDLSLTVCCPYAPGDPPFRGVYYRVGDARGMFVKAMGVPPFDARLSGLIPGLNFVTLFAADAMEGTSIQTRGGTSAMVGAPRVIPIVYSPLSLVPPPLAPAFVGAALTHTLPVQGGVAPFTFVVVEGALPAGVTLSTDGVLSGTPTEAGFFTFTASVTDANGNIASSVYVLSVLGSNPPRLGNISTRGQTLTGDDVLIGGFVIGGSVNKTVVVRARGPSLIPFNVPNALANPTLQLVRSSDQATIATNDDWGSATNAPVVYASGYAPTNTLESAILVNLPPGAYTAIVAGAGGGTGVAIVEVFELDHPEAPLANISTRGRVSTGGDVMIGGFVVQGTGPRTVVVRARGPSLAPFGVANALGNPELRLVRSSDQVDLATNDNWVNAPNRAEIEASGFAPSNILESAILVTLEPGAYTAVVSGAGGTTGVGIVEVFTLP